MAQKEFNAYHKIAANAAINYFNELGETIINFRKMEMKIMPSVIDINHNIISMRNIVFSSPVLEGEFNCQKEGEISLALFNKECMTYHNYVEAIYKTVCDEVDGGDYQYIPHYDTIVQFGMEETLVKLNCVPVKMGQKIVGRYGDRDKCVSISYRGGKPNITFRDIYNIIQIAQRDEFGHYQISRNHALHIFNDRYQMNLCEVDGFHGWVPIMNFVFSPEDGIVKVHTVTNGIINNSAGKWIAPIDTQINKFDTIDSVPLETGLKVIEALMSIKDINAVNDVDNTGFLYPNVITKNNITLK